MGDGMTPDQFKTVLLRPDVRRAYEALWDVLHHLEHDAFAVQTQAAAICLSSDLAYCLDGAPGITSAQAQGVVIQRIQAIGMAEGKDFLQAMAEEAPVYGEGLSQGFAWADRVGTTEEVVVVGRKEDGVWVLDPPVSPSGSGVSPDGGPAVAPEDRGTGSAGSGGASGAVTDDPYPEVET